MINRERGYTMKERHKILFNQLETYREYVLHVLNDVTAETAEIVPNCFRNNIRWNMGHIYLDQYLWIQALTKEKTEVPDDFQKWFGFGTTPENFSEETPAFEKLKEMLKQQPTRLLETYGHRLEEEYPPTEMGMHTIEQVLIRTIFHEGMHLQTIVDIKKSL